MNRPLHAGWLRALTEPGALPALDGLRAVAILLVVVTVIVTELTVCTGCSGVLEPATAV